jgi:hypothetical protein
MAGPTIIGLNTTIRGGAEASMRLNNCCNASLANPSCLAGERSLAVDDDLALLKRECSASDLLTLLRSLPALGCSVG